MALIYLVDKSAWEQHRYSATARSELVSRFIDHTMATCPIITAELLFSARNHAEVGQVRAELDSLVWLETTERAQQRMLDVMHQLARRGMHRSVGVPDLLVAATAEVHGATVLHYDSDFERIAEITGQPHEWIVPRGEGHGRGERARDYRGDTSES